MTATAGSIGINKIVGTLLFAMPVLPLSVVQFIKFESLSSYKVGY